MSTLRTVTGTLVGAGSQINLADTDSLYIAENGIVANTNRSVGSALDFAIYGYGSQQTVIVDGQVSAYWGGVVLVANQTAANSGQKVEVGDTGKIFAEVGFGIAVTADSSSIHNDGLLLGGGGISLTSNASWRSEIVNRGTIDVTNNAILYKGSEDLTLLNRGVISGFASFYGQFGTGAEHIRNSGEMNGSILLGTGGDNYDGHDGICTGLISGMAGNDQIIGGREAETIQGGDGRDILTGGGGADQFIYRSLTESTAARTGRDLIIDFSHADHDQLDLRGIDATSSDPSTTSFHFIGSHAFSGQEGELRNTFHHGHTLVEGDIDGDKHADFEIELGTHVALVKGDFVL